MMIEICSEAASGSDSDDENVCSVPVKSLRHAGFVFPLRHEDDVERLEEMVKTNPVIRKEYITFARMSRTGIHQNIVSIVQRLFTDQSLANYTYHGIKNSQYYRKAMKDYDIFTDCLLDAWEEHATTAERLRKALIEATQRAKQHLSSARYYQRYRNRLLEKRKESWKNKKTEDKK
ncbi:uncharacterized protein LOC135697494 isoform X2 [Ochlerotatus camptorhynchus]|uniref:uncharacterized protein LOC135697494 isoform X2 n=1 Tax=Ochlerotatus camptorhynchus TaxID=644619 RepID=UPI0031CDD1CA